MSIKTFQVRSSEKSLKLNINMIEGLRLFPGILPSECQVMMIDRLLHRDLSNPLHKTNIHHDYQVPYPATTAESTLSQSLFTLPGSSKTNIFAPLNPLSNHKPLNIVQVLQKKLRWLTLGSQYDWTTRSYPAVSPTPFPPDIAELVTTLFKNAFTPESGVVLLYSAKDYMPVHRDVSEECQRGLASFSLGCDGLFIIARDKNPGEDDANEDREQEMVIIRVRSGDIVQMDGETRWSWHAMPKIMAGTCPEWMAQWPVREGGRKEYERWKGYMQGKRLNISCRQVWD
jgi:alkylated DNA repair protein alkB family protein 1